MGGWNRSRYVTGHRDRSAGASRTPLPPPSPDYGDKHQQVPLWEREFCRHVGDITWERFCENKQYVGQFHKHEPWDDSAAFDCFQNAKARFWASYHGQPSDIPLLDDPDLYIDKVDHQCEVDPELVADLDSIGIPFESDDNSASAKGWTNAGANNKCTQNGSGNWDAFIEKPAEVSKWDSEANLASNTTWGGQANVATPEAVWRDQSFSKWGNDSNTSRGVPLEKPSWRGCSKNRYTPNSWSSNFHNRPSDNRYQQLEDPCYTSGTGRKWNGGDGGGGYVKQRSSKQRNQDQGQHQQPRSGSWQQDQRGRSRQWRPVHSRAP